MQDAVASEGGSAVVRLKQLVDYGNELFGVDRLFKIQVGQRLSCLERLRNVPRYYDYGHAGVLFGGFDDGATVGVAQSPVSHDGVVSVVVQLLNRVMG